MDATREHCLRTLGHPVLHHRGAPVMELRRKDLALLAYLCLEGERMHPRGLLATLLWGESPEARARHSLTQTLGRLQKALGADALELERDGVRLIGELPCDAAVLLAGDAAHPEVDDALTLYAGHFLEGFVPGPGAEDFEAWADRTRGEVRNAALRLLEQRGQAAEAAGEWERALAIGERAVEIDPVWEQGRRRVMRALIARGEQACALRYYHEFEAWLAGEVGAAPDPDTRALAGRHLSGEPQPRAVVPVPQTAAGPEAVARQLPPPPARAGRAWLGRLHGERRPWITHALSPVVPVLVAGLPLLLALFLAMAARDSAAAPAPGEVIRYRYNGPVYLAFNGALWEFPDSVTLYRCAGPHPERIRVVHHLPRWEHRHLPSAREQPWMGDSVTVRSDHPLDHTLHVSIGCILTPITDSLTVRGIMGERWRELIVVAPDSLLESLPRALAGADPHPLRAPGTLIRGSGGAVRWVLFHGGSYSVPDPAELTAYGRRLEEAVEVSDAEFRYYRVRKPLPPASSGPCRGAGGRES